jgi:hypothetical protein
VALLWLAYRILVLQPSNQRDWEFGMELLPHVSIAGDLVQMQHVRDFRWPADGPPSSAYFDRSFDLQKLERVWLVQEPFAVSWLPGFDGVAHTYFVFDFQGEPPVAVSVEARRERNEAYDTLLGMVNQYELIYVWGTELDETGRRAVRERNRLYMFPLLGSMDTARRLFLSLAESTRDLETHPRFYNTLTSNCTNELAKAANQAQPGAIPLSWALLFPGYADELLYELSFIPTDAPIDTIRQRYFITNVVQELADEPDFSRLLRTRIRS